MKSEDESVHLLSEQFKASGTVGVTVSEVSQSKRSGSWVPITYMKIWGQRQVLVVSVLEKERQKLELHWQPPDSLRYQAREIR